MTATAIGKDGLVAKYPDSTKTSLEQRLAARARERWPQIAHLRIRHRGTFSYIDATLTDALPRHERRLDAEIAERYGPGRTLAEVSQAWRPYRTWAAVHLRVLREQRTGEISGR